MSKSDYGILFVALIVSGIAAVVGGYWQTIYAIDRANGWIGRGETAGTPAEYIEYMREALDLVRPFHGNPCWWFATEYTNLDRIKSDMKSCIERAETLSTLSPKSDAYQQGMDDLRGKSRVFYDQLNQCRDWIFYFNPVNIILAIVWIIVEIALFIKWMEYG